jgi:hypothetical protein
MRIYGLGGLTIQSLFSALAGPAGVILFGSLVTAGGIFWAAKRNEVKANATADLVKDVSARSGNRKELEELIRARSRVLNSNRNRADDVAAGIIERLPELTAEFKALQQNKLDVYDSQVADFRLKWEPLLQLVLSRFDSFVTECQRKGIDVQKVEVPFEDFPRSNNDPRHRGSYKNRAVRFHAVELHLEYEPILLTSDGYTHARLNAFIGPHLAFNLALGLDDGFAGLMLPGSPDTASGTVAAPKDGIAPKKLLTFVEDAFAKLFERFLIEGNAEPGEQPHND